MGLFELQRAMVDRVLDGGPAPPGLLDEAPGGVEARFRVYARSHRSRWLDILRADFPRVRAVLGDPRFDALATEYSNAHPPDDPMLRNLGRGFPSFVAARVRAPEGPLAADLARLEWAWVEVFDAPNVTPKTRADLAAIAPDAWPGLRFELAAHHRVEGFDHPVHRYDLDAAEVRPARGPTRLLVHRRGFRVFLRPLDAREAGALSLVAGGAGFAEVCRRATTPDATVDEAAAEIVQHLSRWLDEELIEDFRATHPSE